MAGRTKWTEGKIQEFKDAKRGEGHGTNYIPWLNRLSFSSAGRCRSTGISSKTGRVHEFFSDVEYHFFLCLERDKSVLDIREQFPLDRELTQEVARMLSITHPTYPVTHVPVVMTVDFMVTKLVNGEKRYIGFDTKSASDLEKEARTLAKLEIHRETLALMGSPHHIVLNTTLPRDLINKLEWIRRANVDTAEVTPYEGYWDETEKHFLREFSRAAPSITLSKFCVELDASAGLEPGTAMTAGRQLMFKRIIEPDFSARTIQDSKISQFTLPSSTYITAIRGVA